MVPHDPTQFAALVRDHQTMVYRLCYRRLGNHEDAVDATQQVFIKLFAKGDTVHTAVGPWLRQTAINTAVSYLRSELTRRRHERTREPAEPPTEREPLEHAELEQVVRRCLATLEPRDREVVERHLMVGEPQSSIAADWGVTQQAVGKRIRRVKDQLQGHLRRIGITSLGAAMAAMLPTRLVSAGVARFIGVLVGLKPSHGLLPAAAAVMLVPGAPAPDEQEIPAVGGTEAVDRSTPSMNAARHDRVASPVRVLPHEPRRASVQHTPTTPNPSASRVASVPLAPQDGRDRPARAARPSTASAARPPLAQPATTRRPAASTPTQASARPRPVRRGEASPTAASAKRPAPIANPDQPPQPEPPPVAGRPASASMPGVTPTPHRRPTELRPAAAFTALLDRRAAVARPATPALEPTLSAIFLPRVVGSRWPASLRRDREEARAFLTAARIGQEAQTLFPIHLRERPRIPMLVALSAAPIAPAFAGTTVTHPDTDAYADLLANPAYDSVGMITSGGSLGSGVYLGDGWVLTAAHVADDGSDLTFTVDGTDYGVADVYIHDGWTGDLTTGTDIALIQLDAVAPAIQAATLYEPTLTEPTADKDALDGEVVTFVGYGRTGDGDTGATGAAGEKHAGQNVLDAFGGDHFQLGGYDDSIFFVDFDDPDAASDGLRWSDDEALALEYLIAPGDSGGGAFVEIDGVTYLVGINSFLAATDGDADADYGDLAGLTYVGDYYDWVYDIIGLSDFDTDGLAGAATVPEPTALASVALLMAATGLCRRRRVAPRPKPRPPHGLPPTRGQ